VGLGEMGMTMLASPENDTHLSLIAIGFYDFYMTGGVLS
jgi:hypothetical protein